MTVGLSAILLDVAVQTSLILSQHVVYQLDPSARARLNSVFIATFFAGGAVGSMLGTIVYHAEGWWAASLLGAALPLVALLYRTTEPRAAGVSPTTEAPRRRRSAEPARPSRISAPARRRRAPVRP